MILKYFILIVSLFCINYESSGQEQVLNTIAEFSPLSELKDGILLIRIEDYKEAISKLNSFGRYSEVKEFEKKAIQEKEDFLESFKENFKYSSFYFFDSSNSHDVIINDDLSSVYNVNSKIVTDSLIGPFFICKKEELSYSAYSYNKYFQIYKLENNSLLKIKKSFPKSFRMPVWKRLFNDIQLNIEVQYMSDKLQEYYIFEQQSRSN